MKFSHMDFGSLIKDHIFYLKKKTSVMVQFVGRIFVISLAYLYLSENLTIFSFSLAILCFLYGWLGLIKSSVRAGTCYRR